MQHWLKMVGTNPSPLSDDWITGVGIGARERRDLLERVRFPHNRRPSGIDAGDRLVYYAAGWRRYFAVVEVLSDTPYLSDEDDRWPYVLDVHPRVLIARLSDAPPLEDLQLRKGNLSVRRGSHIRLEPGQYRSALEGLIRAAG